MIDNQVVMLLSVIVESVGILLAEKKTAILLYFATILTIILFFMTK